MNEKINTLKISFANEIASEEVPLFRGAIVHAVGEKGNLLFHNHEGDRLRYAYPLIQYKRIHRKAAIVCVGGGTEAIGEFFASCRFDVQIGERPVTLEVESVRAHQTLVQVWDNMFTYRIRKWLPLNQANYVKFTAMESLVEKYAMLERMLTGNILSFAKGLGIHFEKQVECKITAVDEPYVVMYKSVKMKAFDVEFKCNVSIPDYIGLGKGVSLGHGTVVRKYGTSSKKKVFLLGGHDLEMETIKQIIESRPDCIAIDRGLTWQNANLSNYMDVFDLYPKSEYYAVELQEDIAVPSQKLSHYHRIDHHNELSHLPSSLEQVADVLGVELDSHQKLVAANDSGYIPAMKKLKATKKKIAEIRKLDRIAQGVTEEDEKLAEESVQTSLEKNGKLWVVRSLTDNFSTICDKLYPFKSLLVYTDNEWMFYGEGKSELVQLMAAEIKQKKVFHGGPDSGYVGCVRGAYNQDEILQFVEQIKKKYDA